MQAYEITTSSPQGHDYESKNCHDYWYSGTVYRGPSMPLIPDIEFHISYRYDAKIDPNKDMTGIHFSKQSLVE